MTTRIVTTRSRLLTAALIAALLAPALSACSTRYAPRPGPRLSTIVEGGQLTYGSIVITSGQTYQFDAINLYNDAIEPVYAPSPYYSPSAPAILPPPPTPPPPQPR